MRFAAVKVATQRVDVLVEKKIIVETKALRRIHANHLKKLLGTLKNSGYQLRLVINFGQSVQIKRVINTLQNK